MIETWSVEQIEANKLSLTIPHAIYVENKYSPNLLIYFGSYNGQIRGHTTAKNLNYNSIFVRSNGKRWYLEELDFGKTPEECCDYLDTFIQSKSHIKNVCLGGFSMGAFGALLYGTYMKTANKIVANSPQVRYPTYPVLGAIPKEPDAHMKKYMNIDELWDTYNPMIPTLLQACKYSKDGETFVDNRECLYMQRHSNCKISLHPCHGHDALASVLLKEKGRYDKDFAFDK